MNCVETIGYQGGTIFIAANRVVAFQHRKNVGDMTPNGITGRPQTTVWISLENQTEEWIVLESCEDFKRKFIECSGSKGVKR